MFCFSEVGSCVGPHVNLRDQQLADGALQEDDQGVKILGIVRIFRHLFSESISYLSVKIGDRQGQDLSRAGVS